MPFSKKKKVPAYSFLFYKFYVSIVKLWLFAFIVTLDLEPPQLTADEAKLTAEKNDPSKPVESKIQSKYGIEDLLKDSPLVTNSFSEEPQKDVKNDIMNLFEKVFVAIHNSSKITVDIEGH